VRYDELGKPSGFISEGVIEAPFICPLADTPVVSAEFQSAQNISSRSAGNI